jgi:tRNA (guanine-N7-)-methyltransferase
MRRVRQHVNPLKSDLLEIDVDRVQVTAGMALEVELGSGEAHFLMERAAIARDVMFVGVEIRREVVWRANRACAAAGLDSVRSVFANMSVDMPRLFAPASVRRFHVNFPDPWWKSRQQKRRVVSADLVDEMVRGLAPGGEIFVQTDIFDIALEAMATLESEPSGRLRNHAGPWSFFGENPYGARSRRERQCLAEGTKIWRLLFVAEPTLSGDR